MNKVLKPRMYPLIKTMLAVDDDMPRVAGVASAEGLFITAVMVAEGRDKSCIDDRNELFLPNTIQYSSQRRVVI